MKTLITYVVLLLIAGGLFWYYKSFKEQEQQKEATARLSKRVFPMGEEEDAAVLRDSVVEVRLTPRGSTEEIVLQRAEAEEDASPEDAVVPAEPEWQITAPRTLPVDDSAVTSLISSIIGLEPGRDAERAVIADVASDELSRYGLDEEGLRVALRYDGEQTPRALRFGDQDPSEQNRYAMLDGESDVLIVQDREEALNKTVFDLRDKTIIPLQANQVLSLEVANASEETVMRVERGGVDEDWSLQVPVRDAADESEVSSMISQLSSARAEEFVVDDPISADIETHGLDRPEFIITAVSGGGADRATRRLLIASPENEKRAAMLEEGSSIFTISADAIASVTSDFDRLRDLVLISVPATSIERLTYETPDHTFEITPEQATGEEGAALTNWVVQSPPDGFDQAAASDALSTFASSLSSVRATEILPEDEVENLSETGLDPPEVRLIVESEEEPEPIVIEFGDVTRRAETQGRFARREGRDAVMFLEAWRADEMMLDLSDLGLVPLDDAADVLNASSPPEGVEVSEFIEEADTEASPEDAMVIEDLLP